MNLILACDSILEQLRDVISQLDDKSFRQPVGLLGNATVGQHTRHTLEFFLCLEAGFETGVVNYDKRKRDKAIEQCTSNALGKISAISNFIRNANEDAALVLAVNYHESKEETISMPTSFQRELAYNIEHAIHHMAIMKIALLQLPGALEIPKNFGVAISTVRHIEANA